MLQRLGLANISVSNQACRLLPLVPRFGARGPSRSPLLVVLVEL